MDKLKSLTLAVIAALTAGALHAQTSRDEFIERYKPIAIAHAEKYGIPASIKMAQAMLESGNGNGSLATQGNTHFNIKVKASDNWKGPIVYHDDDAPNEAFRAYATPEESWIDHSEYLDTQPRYDSLFRYGTMDYQSWARGLKNAGYATDPQYAQKLIRIIEANNLQQLDILAAEQMSGAWGSSSGAAAPTIAPARTDSLIEGGSGERPASTEQEKIDVDNYIIAMYYSGGRDLLRTQHGRFIVAKKGDTLRTISRLTGIRAGLLSRYNRLEKTTPLNDGQRIKIG
ncbi:MAG: glucosaminidase domain-containing protein [Alistipes sp.]|jgi:hypothetical protein|nr:glucosaminidase domain-containing protein [Alistipes sp.]